MKISVLYLLHQFTFGGSERVVVNLLNHSSSTVNNYVCSFASCDNKFLNELSNPKDVVFSLDKKGGNDHSVPFKIASFCREQNIDIIHSLGWATYAEGLLAAKLGIKKRRFIYAYRGKTLEDTIRIPTRRIAAQRFFSYFCDAILTNSQISRNEYSQEIGIDAGKINVVYNGVDIDKFNTNGGAAAKAVRESFAFGGKDVIIGSVARFDPVKNLNVLVIAFSKLQKELLKRCKLLLIGDGPELTKLKKMVNELNLTERVIFAGMRQDIPICLKCMDIYVQPSIFENIPNSLLEAMATGLPVVATNVGGIPEIVKDRETGLLVGLKDSGELVRSIETLSSNPDARREMGEKGRECVLNNFSIKKMVSGYENLYNEILGNV